MALATLKASEASPPSVDLRASLTAAAEVAFAWDIASDALAWDDNVEVVLGLPGKRIATGRAFAEILDPQNRASREEVVRAASSGGEEPSGRYDLQYALLPDGSRGRRLIVEDVGRWHADGEGRPKLVEGVVRVINERHEREQRLLFLSRYDELTGYLNRTSLLGTLGDALNGAVKTNTSIAFMVLAVDEFRAINEAYGFDVADHVFAAVAQRIKRGLREGDTIGRFGGNKLGVVLRNCDDPDMSAAAERFRALAESEVILTAAGGVAVTISAGAVSLPRHGRTVGDGVVRAQEALHVARNAGHGRFAAFVPSTERSTRRRDNAALSGDLISALNSHHFVLGYQPVVDARTRKLAFNEALLRIQRPESSEIVAADFVTIAERLGLIRLIDERALQLAFVALEQTPDGRLSFNVSGETVGDAAWLSRLAKRLTSRSALASRMIVEITETALVKNAADAERFVKTLRDLGASVAIDDFGAGYSSFKTLRELNVDILKIDGAYVENLSSSPVDQAFVRALTDLAHALNVEIVAERLMDEESAAILKGWGVNYLQGHLIGEAVTVERPPGAVPA